MLSGTLARARSLFAALCVVLFKRRNEQRCSLLSTYSGFSTGPKIWIVYINALLDHQVQGCLWACYGLITGVADVEVQQPWSCLTASDGIGSARSLGPRGMEKKETRVIEEEGMSLNAPLTPQNEIDRLPEVIAPSTIFFGRKYCYRQIGDSISRRRWGSRLWSKGCVCVLCCRRCGVSWCFISHARPFLTRPPLSFCIWTIFFFPCPSLQLLSHFIFYYPITHYHTASISS